jgi:polyphosphate kinase 2 (PPK2 family)
VANELNPKEIEIDGKTLNLQDYVKEHEELVEENAALKAQKKKAVKRYQREEELKPFQAELLMLQQYLEEKQRRMIVLFEGRDAAGKGGTIRRVTRYMNEKHYRVVALGKPTEEQKTQWYYQKYVSQFPRAGEAVLFDRSWYNRAMVERVFNYCSEKEYYDFMRGVVGFERDLVRQDTILVKLYFSVTKEEQARRFERRKTDPLRQWKLSEVDL